MGQTRVKYGPSKGQIWSSKGQTGSNIDQIGVKLKQTFDDSATEYSCATWYSSTVIGKIIRYSFVIAIFHIFLQLNNFTIFEN